MRKTNQWAVVAFFALLGLFAPHKLQAQCSAQFSFAKDTVCGRLPVNFTNASAGSGTLTYLWEFGDASSPSNFSNAQHPTHSYTDTGLLVVSLIVTDGNGCSDTLTDSIYVLQSPEAAFTRYDNCRQLPAKFTNTSTAALADSLLGWKWYFGTGDSSTQKNPQYTYTATGTYSLVLIATTAAGCRDTATQNLTIYSTPQVTVADTQVCAGSSIDFSVVVTETSGVAYLWRFGDGSSSVLKSPLHTFSNAGGFHPRVKVTHGGSDSCFAQFDSITVFSLPQADFYIPTDTFCYDGNNACIVDSSAVGSYYGGALTKRTLVFGDGFIDITTPLGTKTICHNYTDPLGGSYPISLEITDANGCFASKQVAGAIVILPDFTPSFSIAEDKDCFTTQITISNTSAFDSTKISSYKWNFGNGDTAVSPWTGVNYLYTTSGNYGISLTLTDTSGCPKIVSGSTTVQSTVLNFNPVVNKDTSCFFGNNFLFTNPVNPGATAEWLYGDGTDDTGWTVSNSYSSPGNFTVTLHIQAPDCDTLATVKTVTVLGPRANIGNPLNRFQCMIDDTVFFTGSGLPYLSNHGPTPGNVERLWKFNDMWAPQCTTDTKNGINAGLNCNFTLDSMDVKHWYTPGKEACYRITLFLQDTVWGCFDSVRMDLPLLPPKATRDTAATPPINGISFTKPDCLGPETYKAKVVNLSETQPACARETFWVMWDSTCAVQSGNFDANWLHEISVNNYTYTNPPCDTGGRVTIGLILRNGRDTADNFCYDTTWYHNVFEFNDLYPAITHDFSATNRCPGATINFRVTDTTQSGITGYRWMFGDGSLPQNGATLYKIAHTFADAGSYTVNLTMTNADGCQGESEVVINIGFDGDFTISAGEVCVGEEITFFDSAFYFDIGSTIWQQPGRHTAGKETIWWDFGDGNGFATGGSHPAKTFDKVGTYDVTLALKDSSGCTDTITYTDLFTVYGTYADIGITDTLVCPQVYQLIDSTKMYDPLNYFNIPADDSVVSWKWTVAPNNLKSFIKDPYFDFPSGGDYTVKMVVENTRGCVDSATKTMNVKGPVPSFTIIGDTIGCSPLLVTFRNHSINANKYIWNFRDVNNNTFTTLSDTDVFNVYEGGGLYKPFLMAESSEFDSKQNRTVTCRAVFPDTAFQSIRLVAVNATPVANFTNTNACTSFSLNFSDSSTIDSGSITAYQWDFGDGGTSTQQNPTHTFADTGTYAVQLIVFGSSGCADTVLKNIAVAPPPAANFTVQNTCFGHTAQFTDTSLTNNAYVVRWDWDFGDGTTALLQNPTKNYLTAGTYPVKLKILTNAGCIDSVIKNIDIDPLPLVSFTADNSCRFIPVPITNSTTMPGFTPVTYRWDFGNGDTSASATPAYAYTAHGSFIIKVVATSNRGCKDSISQSITIYPKPDAAFSINDSTQCINTNVFSFANASTIASGTIAQAWTFDDGNSETTLNASHTYANPGTYTVSLTETSDFGCTDTATRTVYAFPKPTAGFTVNDTDQCINNHSFVFTNTSTDTGALIYEWDFGNGGQSSLENPVRTYQFPNLHTVRLIAINGNQCRDTAFTDVHILPKPTAAFTINDTGQCVNSNQFVFTNTTAISWGTHTAAWEYGDGGTAATFDGSHTYLVDTQYTVQLIATSGRGCHDTTTRTLTVFPKPAPGFAVNDSDQCQNTNAYVFTNQSTLKYGTNTYVWRYGNAADSSTGTNGNYVYPADGNYTVTLKATSNFNCNDSIQRQITVFPVPQSSFTVNDSSQCLNTNSFVFTGTSTVSSGGMRYHWLFGNGDTATQKDTTVVFAAHGNSSARLITQSDFDCYDTALMPLVIHPVPAVDFTVNDTDQCQNINNFVFNNLSSIATGTITYQWDFGTEGNSAQQHPVFIFANDTTHDVKLKVTSGFQCTDSLTKQVVVFPVPNTAFTINDTGQCVNGNQFDYTNQTTIKYGTLTYNWDLGGGFTSTATDTSVVYGVYGKYKPVLIATSNHNCRDTLELDISVYPKPTPAFSVNDSDQCLTGNNYQTTNTSTIAEGTMTYEWHWRDGTTSTGQQPNHTYTLDSTYVIKMVVTSGFGCMDSTERQVVVYPQPRIEFTINDSGQCVNNNLYQFTNGSTLKYGTLTYTWNFGNGKTAQATDTSLVYAYDSTFRVVLRATTNFGCADTGGRYVIVHSKPNPRFAVNDSDQCVNTNLFQFTNQTTIKQGANLYDWDFGDGNASNAVNPPHVYGADTTYRVRLLATSDFGCVDSTLRTMLVFPKPRAGFTVNDSSQCINTNNFVYTNTTTIKYGTLTYAWAFGNGDGTTVVAPTYVYPLQGTYTVSLVPRSNNNCYDTITGLSILFPEPNPYFGINDTAQCVFDQNFIFTDSSAIDSGTYTQHWRFDDGVEYDSVNVTRTFNNPGIYKAELILTSDELCKDSTDREVIVHPRPNPNFTGLKFYYCTDDAPYPLTPIEPGGTFFGKNMVSDTFVPLITGDDTVRYSVTVNNCTADTTKYTRVYDLPQLELGGDTFMCQREFVIYNIAQPNSTYLWNDGSASPVYRVTQPGVYRVSLFHLCDTLRDTVTIAYRDYDCNFFFPTAFTPNDDQLNDVYLPYMEDVVSMNLKIFNRWGQLLFESNDKTKGWDGRFNGEAVPEGVYVWRVDLVLDESGYIYTHSDMGNVTLIR